MKRTVAERFWEKVDTSAGPDACWPWTAFKNEHGYGQFHDGTRLVRAHRHSLEMAEGPLPEGMVVDHACHNEADCTDVPCQHRACCNPAHLEAVTQKVNSIRGRSGAHQQEKTECPKGHPYSEENTLLRNNGKHRICRACNRASQRRYNESKRKAA